MKKKAFLLAVVIFLLGMTMSLIGCVASGEQSIPTVHPSDIKPPDLKNWQIRASGELIPKEIGSHSYYQSLLMMIFEDSSIGRVYLYAVVTKKAATEEIEDVTIVLEWWMPKLMFVLGEGSSTSNFQVFVYLSGKDVINEDGSINLEQLKESEWERVRNFRLTPQAQRPEDAAPTGWDLSWTPID